MKCINSREVLLRLAGVKSLAQIARDIDVTGPTFLLQTRREELHLSLVVKFCHTYRVDLLTVLAELGVITDKEADTWSQQRRLADTYRGKASTTPSPRGQAGKGRP